MQSVTDITTANLEAYGLFIAGEVQFQRKSYMAAEQSFRKAAERDSLFAQAHYRRATARMRFVVSEQDDEARSAITLAWARREKAGVSAINWPSKRSGTWRLERRRPPPNVMRNCGPGFPATGNRLISTGCP